MTFLESNLRSLFSSPFEGEQPLVTCFSELLRGIELRHQWSIHRLFHRQQSLIAGFGFQLPYMDRHGCASCHWVSQKIPMSCLPLRGAR
jgi:hypothetical protein